MPKEKRAAYVKNSQSKLTTKNRAFKKVKRNILTDKRKAIIELQAKLRPRRKKLKFKIHQIQLLKWDSSLEIANIGTWNSINNYKIRAKTKEPVPLITQK